MKLALAQIDMRLGDIEGICGRIEDQARLAHERGARVLLDGDRMPGAQCSLWAPCLVAWWALPTLSTTCLPV